MTDAYEEHAPFYPADEVRVKTTRQNGATHLAVNFPDIVVDAKVMTFCIHGNGSLSVPSHGDLMRFNHTDLTILIQDTEGVSLRLEDDADSLKAGCQTISMHSYGQCQSHALKLD